MFLKKIHQKMIISGNVLKRGSSQKITLEYDLSCVIRKEDISLSQKYDIILQTKTERSSSSKIIHGKMIFSVYSVKMVFLFPANIVLPFCQKIHLRIQERLIFANVLRCSRLYVDLVILLVLNVNLRLFNGCFKQMFFSSIKRRISSENK